jgi:hypothetical protein
MDLEWDADYDFKTNRMDASNVFANYRRDSIFGSVGIFHPSGAESHFFGSALPAR